MQWVCKYELYIETAFQIIVAAMLQGENSTSINAEYAGRALDCLTRLPQRAGVTHLLSALGRLLTRTKEACSSERSGRPLPLQNSDHMSAQTPHLLYGPAGTSGIEPRDANPPPIENQIGTENHERVPEVALNLPFQTFPQMDMGAAWTLEEWNIDLSNIDWDWSY